MNDKVNLTKYQNHHHHRGVFDTCTKWTRPQAKWAYGLAGQGLRRFGPSLGCHTSTQGGEARVGGGRSTQPPSQHLVPYRPLQVGGGHIHPYKYPPSR
jgi:hypothetical protein